MTRWSLLILGGLGLLCAWARTASALDLAAGDILVVDATLAAVVHVDPVAGDRTILSSSSVGAGTNFAIPLDIALESSGHLLVTDLGLQALFRVDPATGDRTVLSSSTVGNGPVPFFSWGVTIGLDGNVYVTSAGAVIRVDPVTGDRTLATSTDQTFQCVASGDPYACCTGFQTGDGNYPCAPGVGSGPELDQPRGIEAEPTGDFLFVESTPFGSVALLHRFSTLSGDRVTLSGFGETPLGMAIESNGKVLAADISINVIYRVDPSTGSSSPLYGSGPAMLPRYIALNASGDALVTDGTGAVFLVDAATGDRSIVSSSTVGAGPNFVFPQGIVVVGPATPPIPALPSRGIAVFVALSLGLLVFKALHREDSHRL